MPAWYSKIESMAILHVHGNKASEFLQGQLSCDMRQISPTRAGLAVHCNPSGRVIADLLVLQTDEQSYLLLTPRWLLDPLRSSLSRYAMFSRTQLEEAPQWQIFGLHDLAATGVSALTVQSVDETSRLCQLPAADLSLFLTHQQDLPAAWTTEGEQRPERCWQAAAWRAGLVSIADSHSAQHTPQSLNYDLTGHLSFNKGCYTGQEVIARLHYRGKAKKRLTLWHCASSAPSTTALHNEAGECVGEAYASLTEDSGYLLWAFTPTDPVPARLSTTDGHSLSPVPLWFANH